MQSVVAVIKCSTVFYRNQRTERDLKGLMRNISTKQSQLQVSMAAGLGLEIYPCCKVSCDF